MKKLTLLVLLLLSFSNAYAQRTFTGKPRYQIEVRRADTLMGRIVVELFPAIAPLTVANFDSLVEIHFFDSTAFHRVIPGFVIQGGDPNSRSGDTATWGYGDPSQNTIPPEFTAVSHQRGILSMARSTDPASASSQFFICVAPAVNLDHKYAAFGKVVSGMNVVDSIVAAPRVLPANRPIVKMSMFVTRIGSNDTLASTTSLASPASNTTIGHIRQVVRWHKVPDAMLYHLQLANDPEFKTIIVDTNRSQVDTSFTLPFLASGKIFYWRVQNNNGGSFGGYSDSWTIITQSSGVEASGARTALEQNYPNPVQGSTSVRFSLDRSAQTSLKLYNILGECVRTYIEGYLEPGEHIVQLPLNALNPGVYRYELRTGDASLSRQLIVE